MNAGINSNEELQKDRGGADQADLFPELGRAARRRRPLRADMVEGTKTFFSVSYENALFMLMGIIMALIVAFGLGVERGKCAAKIYYAAQQKPRVDAARPSLPAAQAVAGNRRVNKTVSGDIQGAKRAVLPQAPPKPAAAAIKAEPLFFTVQVASFRNKGTAEQELFKLKGMRYDAFLKDDGGWMHLYVGRYRSHDEAQGALKGLKGKYADAYVTTVKTE